LRELLFVLAIFLVTLKAFGSENIESDKFQTLIDQARLLCDRHAAERLPGERGCPNVLVGYDVDNTLLNPPTVAAATGVPVPSAEKFQQLGSDEWFTWQAGLIAPGMPPSPFAVAEDMDSLLGIDALLLGNMHEQVVDRGGAGLLSAPQVVKALQDFLMPSIVVTARGPRLREATERELKAAGYHFERPGMSLGPAQIPVGRDGTFAPYDPASPEKSGLKAAELAPFHLAPLENQAEPLPVSYANGIFMVNGQHKGAMLRTLLANTRARMPKAILYIDDTPSQVQKMQAAFAGSGIEVVTIQFTKTYPRVVEFFESDKTALAQQGKDFVKSLTQQMKTQMGIK
jgi:hypothetical protein